MEERLSQPVYSTIVQERDLKIPMRDGVRLAVDVYRPDAPGRFPVLLAFAIHNKFLQSPEVAAACNNQPAWSPLWCGPAEGGDTTFFTSRGYVHVVGNLRGSGHSDPGDLAEGKTDAYDLIEWIAQQPWCDGNVGMVGISDYGRRQIDAALTQPPHLKAIFPYDPSYLSFRDTAPGGVIHCMKLHMLKFGSENYKEMKLTPREEALWQEAWNNPDYRMYTAIFNVLEGKGKLAPNFFKMLIDPYEPETPAEREKELEKIRIPIYHGSGWYAYTYKGHIFGTFQYWEKCKNTPFKKLLLTGPAHLPRPWTDFHNEILRWYDHWLKGIDTGILAEPRVKSWVMGANRWRYSDDWPLKETRWTKLYLNSWERLQWEPFTPSSRDGIDAPDCFAQMPLSRKWGLPVSFPPSLWSMPGPAP